MNPTLIHVRGYHLDVFQHVNNARYLEFLEEARWAYFDTCGITPLLLTSNTGMAVINIDIHYRCSAHINDILLIHTRFTAIHPRKAELLQTITFQATGKIVATAKVIFVAINRQNNKAIAFNNPLCELLHHLAECSNSPAA